MDCTRASQILAAAFDGPVDANDLARAREHCLTCSECADLARALDALAAVPAPGAPADLVDRIVEIGTREALRIRSDSDAETARTTPIDHEIKPGRPGWWAPRLATFAAAAAVLLVAVTLTGLGIGGMFRGQEAAVEERELLLLSPVAPSGLPEASTGVAAADKSAIAPAPDYVVFGSGVYRLVGDATAQGSALTSAGTVYTALDSLDASPTSLPAYRPTADAFALVVERAPGDLIAFEPVTRRFASDEYQLQSGGPIVRFGDWPTLPSGFAAPATEDGSPSFAYFGSDDTGVRIFVTPGGQPQDGFAVAPGTRSTDPVPAAPVWTWWRHLR
ncbi:MAG: hypothetical protein ACYC77_06465 [Coriobacteriia bacterium]